MTRSLDDSAIAPSGPGVRGAAGLAVAIGVALAIAAWFGPQPARASSAQPASGDQLYAQHCASCHQPAGEGLDGAFPPLAGNPAATDQAYVEATIRDGVSGPLEVLGVAYDAEMPPVVALTEQAEIEEVARYVVDLAASGGSGSGGDSDEPASTQPNAEGDDASTGPVIGDVDRGHDLFVGSARLENGGGACAACHTAGSVGNLGGPGLGPDLTDAFQALGGEVGLTGWMINPPSATMQPLFADRPLTEAELADVVAFLGDAPNQDKADTGYDRLLVAGIVGAIVLIAGMAVAWRGMRQTYRDRLLARPGDRHRRPGRAIGQPRPTPPSTGRPRPVAKAGRSSR